MRKKLHVIVWMAVLLIAFVFPSSVKANAYNEETVFDYAELLTSEEETALREYAEKYEKYDVSVIFLTTDDAEGKSSMAYSDDFYDTNGFRPDGVLFMIDMDNREVYINTVGKCINWLEEDVYDILDDTYLYATDGEYFECLSETSRQACKIVENHANPVLGALSPSPVIIVIALVITVVVLVVLITKHNKANKKIPAERYMGSSFVVNDKNVIYKGCRKEVVRGYYAENKSSGGGGSHTSSRGVSHGGGGHKF